MVKYNDAMIESFWDNLTDIPIDEDECIEVEFLSFPVGTHREEVWHWFDEHHSKGVGWLMNERETKY